MPQDYTRFIILSDARTGSNLVQDALNAHPKIVCFRELFNLDEKYIDYDAYGYDGHNAEDIALRARDPRAFLSERVFGIHAATVGAVGFKFHYHHFWFHADLLPALTREDALRVVHLERKNMLRSLVSAKIAEQTGEWLRHDETKKRRNTLLAKVTAENLVASARHPGEAVARIRRFLRPINTGPIAERTSLTLTQEDCERHFYRVRHEIAHFKELFAHHSTIDITYEGLVADRNGVLARVEEFLGVEPAPLGTTLRRQNPEPLRELITNYDELRAAFAGSEYEGFFDD